MTGEALVASQVSNTQKLCSMLQGLLELDAVQKHDMKLEYLNIPENDTLGHMPPALSVRSPISRALCSYFGCPPSIAKSVVCRAPPCTPSYTAMIFLIWPQPG